MTKEEFLKIKSHTRVKYAGTDPSILKRFSERGPKTALTKGVVFGWSSDYTGSAWGNPDRGIVMRIWSGGSFDNVNPADWVIVDSQRKDLEHNRERRHVRKTDVWVRRELSKFSSEFRAMKDTKERIDRWLNEVPLADRFKILTTLSEEQKVWLQLVSMDPEEVIETIKKIANEDPADTAAEVAEPPISNA